MDNNSLAHTKWECKYHLVFAPKYNKTNNIRKIEGRSRKDIKRFVRKKRNRNNAGRVLCRPYTHVG